MRPRKKTDHSDLYTKKYRAQLSMPIEVITDDGELELVRALVALTKRPKDLVYCSQFPFFTPSSSDKTTFNMDIKTKNETASFTITPLSGMSRATMSDKRFFIYYITGAVDCIDKLRKKSGNDELMIVNQSLVFDAEYMLQDMKYQRPYISEKSAMWDAVKLPGQRLKGTLITTSIKLGEEPCHDKSVSFLDLFEIYRGSDGRVKVRVKLADWVWQSLIANPIQVLTLDREYIHANSLKLKGGLARRIYEICQHATNRKAYGKFKVVTFMKLCGTSSAIWQDDDGSKESKKKIKQQISNFMFEFRSILEDVKTFRDGFTGLFKLTSKPNVKSEKQVQWRIRIEHSTRPDGIINIVSLHRLNSLPDVEQNYELYNGNKATAD